MFLVGKIVGTFGNKGDLKIYPLIHPADYLLEMDSVFIEDDSLEKREFKVLGSKKHKNVYIFSFESINDMNVAEGLIDCPIYVPSIELKELQDNEYYYHQLEGLTVYSDAGELIGKVDHITKGGQDILVVKDENSGKEIMIPFVDELVPEVNLEQKTITVNLIDGLVN